MRMRFSSQATVLALMLAAGSAAAAPAPPSGQQKLPGPPQPITWSIALEPAAAPVKAGGTLKAVVTAKIDDGWHVYAPDDANSGPRPVHITVTENPVFTQTGKMDAPEPEREMDEAFGQITASYTHEAVFRIPVTVASGAEPATYTLKLEITSQACDGRMCLPPKVVRLETQVQVTK